jgi:hypothetical protein
MPGHGAPPPPAHPPPDPARHGPGLAAAWRPPPAPAALGTSKQAVWEAHSRWIDGQAEQHQRSGYEGLDDGTVAAARALAGEPEPA